MAAGRNGWPGRAVAALAAVEDAMLVAIVTAMIALAASQIFLRNVLDSGISWGDPLLRVLVLWVALVGAMVATRDDNQISIDVLSRFLPDRLRQIARVVTDLFTAAVCAILAWHGAHFVLLDWRDGIVAFAGVPAWTCEIIIPVGFGVIALRYLLFCVTRMRSLASPAP